jgi:hypothetical protein
LGYKLFNRRRQRLKKERIMVIETEKVKFEVMEPPGEVEGEINERLLFGGESRVAHCKVPEYSGCLIPSPPSTYASESLTHSDSVVWSY